MRALFPPRCPPCSAQIGEGAWRVLSANRGGLEFPPKQRSSGLGSWRVRGAGGLGLFDQRFSSRRRLGRGVSVCWRWWCLPRWIRGAACQSRGASGLWGYPPGCRGVEAGAGPGQAHPEGLRGAGSMGSYLAPGPHAALHPADGSAGGGDQKGRLEWGDEGS